MKEKSLFILEAFLRALVVLGIIWGIASHVVVIIELFKSKETFFAISNILILIGAISAFIVLHVLVNFKDND